MRKRYSSRITSRITKLIQQQVLMEIPVKKKNSFLNLKVVVEQDTNLEWGVCKLAKRGQRKSLRKEFVMAKKMVWINGFAQKWVDIGSKKKDGFFSQKCGRSKQKKDAKT
jgi:hypothetical protein